MAIYLCPNLMYSKYRMGEKTHYIGNCWRKRTFHYSLQKAKITLQRKFILDYICNASAYQINYGKKTQGSGGGQLGVLWSSHFDK